MNRRRLASRGGLLLVALALAACRPQAASGETSPLVLERTVSLPQIEGRIDHLAVDVAGKRLFVAAVGAGQVAAIDLTTGRVLGRVTGLAEPQGIAFLPTRDEIAVASGGDGTLRFYKAGDLSPVGALRLGGDADNVRVDPASGKVVVGHGSGALAIIDPATRTVRGTVPLPAHPEGFQLEGDRAWVNLPDAGRVAAVSLTGAQPPAAWRNPYRYNFPLAHDEASKTVAVVYRLPARLVLFGDAMGEQRQALPTCGDSDDVFFDDRRARIYVICGAGQIDVFQSSGSGYAPLAHVASRDGARTGLFAPQLDRLFVAARAQTGREAAILVFAPSDAPAPGARP